MSYAWGNQTVEEAKRNLVLIREMLRPIKAVAPRSDIQYWVTIFLMLGVGTLLMATLLNTSPIF